MWLLDIFLSLIMDDDADPIENNLWAVPESKPAFHADA
jgi:hypothetical protein